MNGDGGAIPRPEKQNSKFKILWGMVKFHTGSEDRKAKSANAGTNDFRADRVKLPNRR